MADVDDGGLSGGVEIFFAVGGEDEAAFTPDGLGIIFSKVAREQGRHGGPKTY